MTAPSLGGVHSTAPESDLDRLAASWRRHLVAQRMSPATLSTYGVSVRLLDRFIADRGMPQSPAAISREHVEAFIADLLERWKPATAPRPKGRQQERSTSLR